MSIDLNTNGAIIKLMINKNDNGFSIIELITAVSVVLILGFLGFRLLSSLRNNKSPNNQTVKNSSLSSSDTSESDIKTSGYVYYVADSKLYKANVDNGIREVIDSDVLSTGGSVGEGSDYPNNSPRFDKVAYIKASGVWVYDGKDSTKVSQISVDGTTGNFMIIGWSSDSNNLVYSISYGACGYTECYRPPKELDESLVGYYWYSIDSGRTDKISIPNAYGWIPGTTKIYYLEDRSDSVDLTDMRTYDVMTGEDAKLSTVSYKYSVGQFNFSFDGSKITYLSDSYIVVADRDNSNAHNALYGENIEYQFPNLLANNKDLVVIETKQVPCNGREPDNSDDSCHADYLMKRIDSTNTSLVEILRFIGMYDNERALIYDSTGIDGNRKHSLIIIDINSGKKISLSDYASDLDLTVR